MRRLSGSAENRNALIWLDESIITTATNALIANNNQGPRRALARCSQCGPMKNRALSVLYSHGTDGLRLMPDSRFNANARIWPRRQPAPTAALPSANRWSPHDQ